MSEEPDPAVIATQRRRLLWGSTLASVLALAILVPGLLGVLGALSNWLPYGLGAAVLAAIGWYQYARLSGGPPRHR